MTLREAAARLKAKDIADPMYEARLLFSTFGKLTASELYGADPWVEDALIEPYLCRRENHEPMAYILGEQGFYRESYFVTPDTLIPREDTEILVDYLVKHLPPGARFADLCTGSGCIALSALNNTRDTRALAVDISAAALAVAGKNAERLHLSARIDLGQADVLSEEFLEKMTEAAPFAAIVSNPPYIPDEVYRTLAPEIFFEPREALVAEEEGMLFYRTLIPVLLPLIEEDGFLAFEVGYDQAPRMRALAEKNGCKAEILSDLSGNARVVVLRVG